MHLPTRIPTWLGILLLLVIMTGLVLFFESQGRLPTRASPSLSPTKVEITNVTEATFTVSWLTESPATGAVLVEGSSTKQLVFDERDLAQAQGNRGQAKFTSHSVAIRDLEPQTEYNVKLVSGGKVFQGSEGKPYIVRTAPRLSGGSGLEPAFGTVITTSGQPADGALIYLTLEGGQILSTLVKPSGSWIIPLNLARSRDLSGFLTGDRISENIKVRLGTETTAAITDTLNDSPVPEMTLGKTYDFRRQQGQGENQLAQTSPASVLGETSGPSVSANFAIVKPAPEAKLTTTLPLIQGTGVAGKSVVVTVGITQPTSGTTTVGADGIWRFTPTKPLSPGKQAVTATSQDASGKPVAVTQTFEVLKEGTQVLGEATPSATLAPTFTPTQAASPTPTSTLSGQPLPQSGSILPTLILLLLGLGLLGSGAAIFIK